MKNVKQNAADNFLSSLDISMPIREQQLNAMNDAFSYGWNQETLRTILQGIEKAYRKKGEK